MSQINNNSSLTHQGQFPRRSVSFWVNKCLNIQEHKFSYLSERWYRQFLAASCPGLVHVSVLVCVSMCECVCVHAHVRVPVRAPCQWSYMERFCSCHTGMIALITQMPLFGLTASRFITAPVLLVVLNMRSNGFIGRLATLIVQGKCTSVFCRYWWQYL